MEKLIFACMAPSRGSGLPVNVPLFAASVRKFAGALSECPLWVLVPQVDDEIPKTKKLESLNVKVIPFENLNVKFPFAEFVCATAAAESLAVNNTTFLAWMGLDTIIMKEPTHFLLNKDKTVGYRPVHHTLIGSLYEKPLDPFWELVYRKCRVSEDKIFPMRPHVDQNIIRPYFNAGYLVVRPEIGLLQTWWDYFKELYCDPSFEEYYEKNELYTIFIHQAVLTGVILSTTKRQELQKLPFTYNYPLHLYEESPPDLRPQNVNDLVTVRYEEPHVLETIPFHDSFKRWLRNQLHSLSKTNRP